MGLPAGLRRRLPAGGPHPQLLRFDPSKRKGPRPFLLGVFPPLGRGVSARVLRRVALDDLDFLYTESIDLIIKVP